MQARSEMPRREGFDDGDGDGNDFDPPCPSCACAASDHARLGVKAISVGPSTHYPAALAHPLTPIAPQSSPESNPTLGLDLELELTSYPLRLCIVHLQPDFPPFVRLEYPSQFRRAQLRKPFYRTTALSLQRCRRRRRRRRSRRCGRGDLDADEVVEERLEVA